LRTFPARNAFLWNRLSMFTTTTVRPFARNVTIALDAAVCGFRILVGACDPDKQIVSVFVFSIK
ncbi:MAG: hypothetical protein ABW168_27540, partial [Sedimenticola sp.]